MSTKPWYTQVWAWVAGAFGLLAALFLFERSKREEAESKLESSEVDKKDALLQQDKNRSIEELKKFNDEAVHLKAESEKAKEAASKMTSDEVVDFYKKRE